ncbi:hypothetical protein AX15_007249 [Amanita polypyramis BW_CC]|nr:hypothetical protein AX15_007249 [Amanita polypyramis BW_CC]
MTSPRCKHLVLDAGPLLSLAPLRGLAESYYTVPQVLAELKDKRAREHLEQLGLLSGVKLVIKSPDAASLAHVIQWAKKTGDYSVLSLPDLSVLALTYMLHKEGEKAEEDMDADEMKKDAEEPKALATAVDHITERLGKTELTHTQDNRGIVQQAGHEDESPVNPDDEQDDEGDDELEPLQVEIHSTKDEDEPPSSHQSPGNDLSSTPVFEDPPDEDDGEGEWITPDNIALHKSRALGLLPSEAAGKAKEEKMWAGCMTVDFAMQNVLLQMGLSLVGLEGKRIEKVKTWVLRCHACYKLCKDNSKKFCPSCGNPTLIRASVTIARPGADAKAPTVQVHLKKNFQYRLRGTRYSIPAPKPGSAKTGSGEGLILREDQLEYMRAKKRISNKREREEAKMLKGMTSKGASAGVPGSWMDPDWVPEMMRVGAGGKGRTRNSGELPQIGHGRKNPNERRWRK